MKEGALAGKRLDPSPCFSSAKKRRDRRKAGYPRQKPPPLPMKELLPCAPERFPLPSGPGSLPGPGGEALRWAKRRLFSHGLELHFRRCSQSICFLRSLFAEEKWRRRRGFDPAVWPARSASPPGPEHQYGIMNENEK